MNASGHAVWFNLCGWRDWYAAPDPSLVPAYPGGQSLGNSYRISGDGGSWGAITEAVNVMARVAQYTHPGGYPDPDNILGPHGTVGRVTESQARVQMVPASSCAGIRRPVPVAPPTSLVAEAPHNLRWVQEHVCDHAWVHNSPVFTPFSRRFPQ